MQRTITQQVLELQHMNLPELQEKFKEVFGYSPMINKPQALKKRIALRIQELFYGNHIEVRQNANAQAMATARQDQKGVKPETAMTPGTVFSGLWRGKVYEATVTADGKFEYGGKVFRSLSAVVREITGTHMQYKVFFRLGTPT